MDAVGFSLLFAQSLKRHRIGFNKNSVPIPLRLEVKRVRKIFSIPCAGLDKEASSLALEMLVN